MTSIEDNIKDIEERMVFCARKSGRTKDDIVLVAVSKTVSAEMVVQAEKAGIRNFGENRVQEYLKKREVIGDSVIWHIIGSLQCNKAKYIVPGVALLHSLDRLEVALEIERQCQNKGTTLDTLVQVNIAKEPTKAGVVEEELERFLEQLSAMRSVHVKGLMAIPPAACYADDNRRYFARMKMLYDRFEHMIPDHPFTILSMGMSDDFEAAILEGSNMVRIGTAVFGARPN